MSPCRHPIGVLATLFLTSFAPVLATDTVDKPHARVEYSGIDVAYAEAVARLVEEARAAYVVEFGCDMPERVHVSVTCGRDQPTRLWNDGADRVYLTLRSEKQLARPEESGVFNLYGICHELGHIAMYRRLRQRSWLSGDAAEGWAQYAGSAVVDRVYEKLGADLWPDSYDYRADGTQRLEKQLADKKSSAVAAAAGQWRRLGALIGPASFGRLFHAWDEVDVDAADPAPALLSALRKVAEAEKADQLQDWFESFAKDCIVSIERSTANLQTIDRKALSGSPIICKWDDGSSDGKKSIAGSGHAVFFDAPAGDWYLTQVQFFGSRYGRPQAPQEDFTVTLCDDGLRPITSWDKAYSLVQRGDAKWYRIPTPPTKVPARFAVVLNFNPTGTKGVFLYVDDGSNGHSATGLPGRGHDPLDSGEWMIRVEIDSPETSDPLRPK